MKSHSHGKRMFLPLAALILVLACAPAAAPAIPAADPNAIQLYIQQTAAAASTQTQDALPPASITPTITFTPRSTFTPYATFTPFQTFVLASPTPLRRSYFFRVKHDSQLAIYDFKSRTAAGSWTLNPQTPEVVPLFAAPKEASGTHRTPITRAWESYMDELNNGNEKKLRYLKATHTALFNGAGFPQMESLTMGGNIITLDAIQGDWGKVHTLPYGSPPSASVVNYFTSPDLVHKFVVVGWSRASKATYWVDPPQGDTYWPFVSRHVVWIQMSRLEPFPGVPMQVTARGQQEVKQEPKADSRPTGFTLEDGASVTIVEYYPTGSDVWARIQSGGWIALLIHKGGVPKYLTSWSMETVPPPPPPPSE